MEHLKIFFCKKCRALDYAKERCPKCGNTEIDEAGTEFLMFGNSTIQNTAISDLLTRSHFVEKIGWN